MRNIIFILLVSATVFGSLVAVSQVGKPRKVLTGPDVVGILIVNALMVWGIALLWGDRL